MTNFNATLAQNTEVRKEIDHLVQERSNFNDLIAKLQKKSQANKRIIADITEMAILAFDQRDESQSKITAFQVCNDSYIFACIHFLPLFYKLATTARFARLRCSLRLQRDIVDFKCIMVPAPKKNLVLADL